jgi:iron complex transport system substrate-binding protein
MKLSSLAAVVLLMALSACSPSSIAPSHSPKGIISLAPNLTETIYSLGGGDRVIAVGNFDDWPPEILTKPRAGGYLDPDLEKITLLNPELLVVPGQHPKVSEFAKLRGIQVLNVHMDSIATIDAGLRTIGEALGASARAEALVAQLQAQRAVVEKAVEGLPRPKVLIITQRQAHDLNTLYSSGGTSFVSEMVTLAGGENIYADTAQTYFEASKETVVVRAPDVILEFHCGEKLDETAQAAYRTDWKALSGLPAVQQGRIHLILEAHGLRPGPRVVEIARLIALMLHPGVDLALGSDAASH